MICDEGAIYKIKDSSDFYCQECAEENFADLTLLIKVEEEAQRLKAVIKENMSNILESEEELDKIITMTEKPNIDASGEEEENTENQEKDQEDIVENKEDAPNNKDRKD
jgi:hypothetical protein